MGKCVAASVILISCVTFAAFALVPNNDSVPSVGSPGPSAVPIASDASGSPVQGTIDFCPSDLNLRSGGKYVTMHLALEGASVSSVYIPSVKFMGTVYAETCFSDHETGADKENSPHMVLKFLREDVRSVLFPGEHIPIFMTGLMVDGTPFYASGFVDVSD